MRRVLGAIEVHSERAPQHDPVELDYPFVPHRGVGGLTFGNVVAPLDPRIFESVAVLAANQARGMRVVVPRSGVLRDLAVYVGAQSGNIDVGVYSLAEPRVRLYSTGSIACPAANAWRIVGDPLLEVEAGDELDFVLCCDNAVATFARHIGGSSGLNALPAGFWDAAGGSRLLAWAIASSFPLPATLADAALSANNTPWGVIARVA